MPQLRPPTSFLLRGSAMLIALLILWWWVLLDPMLSALEGVGNVAGRLVFGGSSVELMRKESAGNWTFHVPKKILVPASAGNPALRINFIEFDVARADLIAFTFSLPVFWAVVLAAPHWRRNLRPLLLGTGLITLVELILLSTFAASSAQRAAAAMFSVGMGGLEKWILWFGDYLSILVVPYVAPTVIALAVHSELRRAIFGWTTQDKSNGGEIRSRTRSQESTTRATNPKAHRLPVLKSGLYIRFHDPASANSIHPGIVLNFDTSDARDGGDERRFHSGQFRIVGWRIGNIGSFKANRRKRANSAQSCQS